MGSHDQNTTLARASCVVSETLVTFAETRYLACSGESHYGFPVVYTRKQSTCSDESHQSNKQKSFDGHIKENLQRNELKLKEERRTK
jgi:hypothetical protein